MAKSHCESSTRNKWGQSKKKKTARRTAARDTRQSRGGGAGTRGGAAHNTHLVIVYRNCQKGGKFYRTIPVEIASRSFAAPPNGVVLHVQSFAETVASWVHLCDGIFSIRKKKDK